MYPEHVTSGDILEVRFFFEASVEPLPYKLGVGDLLSISVSDNPDLGAKDILILSDGSISLPGVGQITTVGLSVEDIKQSLQKRYHTLGIRRPDVTVHVLQGQQRLRGLLEARGGGDSGNIMNIPVFEGTPIELPFIGSVATDRPLKELREEVSRRYRHEFGGQLAVTINLRQRSVPGVFIMGEVRRPGRVEMARKLTPLGAVAAAGGFMETADTTQVAVVRFDKNKGMSRWIFDLSTALSNEQAEHHRFHLKYDDIIVVVKTGVADANVWVAQYIRNMLPINVGTTIQVQNQD